jgi:hypothetical protein
MRQKTAEVAILIFRQLAKRAKFILQKVKKNTPKICRITFLYYLCNRNQQLVR